jgi:hypothetical protein
MARGGSDSLVSRPANSYAALLHGSSNDSSADVIPARVAAAREESRMLRSLGEDATLDASRTRELRNRRSAAIQQAFTGRLEREGKLQ